MICCVFCVCLGRSNESFLRVSFCFLKSHSSLKVHDFNVNNDDFVAYIGINYYIHTYCILVIYIYL